MFLQCGHGGNLLGCGGDAARASVAWADLELEDAATLVFALKAPKANREAKADAAKRKQKVVSSSRRLLWLCD